MIGQRQHVDAVCGRAAGNVGRRQETVRAGGMAVEIAVEHGNRQLRAAERTVHHSTGTGPLPPTRYAAGVVLVRLPSPPGRGRTSDAGMMP